jgi:hypothetical protein
MERLCKVYNLLLDLFHHFWVTLHLVKYCAESFHILGPLFFASLLYEMDINTFSKQQTLEETRICLRIKLKWKYKFF